MTVCGETACHPFFDSMLTHFDRLSFLCQPQHLFYLYTDIIKLSDVDYMLYELYHDEVSFFEGHLFTEHFKNWYTVRERCVVSEEMVFPKQYVDNAFDNSTFFSPFCAGSAR